MRGEPKKPWKLSSGGQAPCRLPLLREYSRIPSVSVLQLVLLWEAMFSFSEFFFQMFSTCLPISWWVIYERTCPHCAQCSSVFDQNQHDPHASPSLFTQSHHKQPFLLPLVEKFLKGKHFAHMEEVKQKTAEALKGIKINKFKNCFEQWKKCLSRCIASWRVLWRWLKFKHVRINTQFFINKFWFGGFPLI